MPGTCITEIVVLDLFFRSPVFNAMFIHNMTENQKKEIDIEDLDIETVKDMLRYDSLHLGQKSKPIDLFADSVSDSSQRLYQPSGAGIPHSQPATPHQVQHLTACLIPNSLVWSGNRTNPRLLDPVINFC